MSRDDFKYIKDIGSHTRREDNTDAERLTAARTLSHNAENAAELREWLDMLGIQDEWLKPSEDATEPVERDRATPRSERVTALMAREFQGGRWER